MPICVQRITADTLNNQNAKLSFCQRRVSAIAGVFVYRIEIRRARSLTVAMTQASRPVTLLLFESKYVGLIYLLVRLGSKSQGTHVCLNRHGRA